MCEDSISKILYSNIVAIGYGFCDNITGGEITVMPLCGNNLINISV